MNRLSHTTNVNNVLTKMNQNITADEITVHSTYMNSEPNSRSVSKGSKLGSVQDVKFKNVKFDHHDKLHQFDEHDHANHHHKKEIKPKHYFQVDKNHTYQAKNLNFMIKKQNSKTLQPNVYDESGSIVDHNLDNCCGGGGKDKDKDNYENLKERI